MPNAKVDEVVRNMIKPCYGCAGQRWIASSANIGVGDEIYRTIFEKFVEESRKVVVANPLDPAVAKESMLMGP